jgi:hypothetical protein
MASNNNAAPQQRLFLFLGMAGIAVLGLFLYWDSLSLLLFWDDVPHMQWLDTQRGGGYWFTAEGFPFYRPTAFTVWDVSEAILGTHDPRWLHGLSVGLHTINALLVVLLVRLLSNRVLPGVLAGIVFVAFPFSYQTVIPTAAQFHLWLVFGLLAASILAIMWLAQPAQRFALPGSWFCVFWAIFSHESGVLVPVLMLGVLWAYAPTLDRATLRRIIIAIGPPTIFATVYLLAWLTIPKANDATSFQLAALDVKVAQTLQALSFPLAAFTAQLFTPDEGTLLAWGCGLIVVGLVGGWLWWQPWRVRVMAGLFLLWVPLVMLPAWLFLDASYLLGSPRLHYLASVGVAVLWGLLMARPLPLDGSPLIRHGVGLAVLVGVLLITVPFVQARNAEHQRIDDIYQVVLHTAETLTSEDRLLLVNGPAYLAPEEPTFLLGAEGSTYLPDFIVLGDWLALNGTENMTAHNRHAADLTPTTNVIFAVTHPPLDRNTISDYSHVMQVQQLDGELQALSMGHRTHAATASSAGEYDIGVRIRDLSLMEQGSMYQASIVWERQAALTAPVSVFVHLLCDGVLVAQADGPPLGRLYPLSQWASGERWHDWRYLVPQSPLSAECVQLFVGLFDPNTGERYPVTGAEGIVRDGLSIQLSATP